MGCNATTEMYMYISFFKKKNQRKEKWPKQLVYLIIKTWCRVTCTSFVPLHYSIIIKSTSQKKHPNVYKQTKQCLQLQSYTWYSERNIKGTSHGTHVKRLDPYTQTIRLIRSDFHNEGFLTVISIMSFLHTVSDILPWCSVSSKSLSHHSGDKADKTDTHCLLSTPYKVWLLVWILSNIHIKSLYCFFVIIHMRTEWRRKFAVDSYCSTVCCSL